MGDPEAIPSNFDESRRLYEGMSPKDLIAQLVARDALLRVALQRSREAEKDSLHDPLTGVLNRRGLAGFLDKRRQEFRRAIDVERTDLALLIDLDKFKTINDTLGHSTGDKTLQQVARVLELSVRQGDQVGRLGGDEFFAVLLAATPATGRKVAERMRASATIARTADPSVPIPTFSIGIAPINYTQPTEILLDEVDRAMYTAKGGGGDRIYAVNPGIIKLPE